eukprot:TRINITY_DN58552_c0_g1_i1.p1 TRINITY_DN58552_c0_g1~~TRINITY_DN58552_c0_g1_i1.p1  ORF type:complete len:407 (-),score=47.08 TRINITY_DN58552_c0_g1_i1:84-1304(-)
MGGCPQLHHVVVEIAQEWTQYTHIRFEVTTSQQQSDIRVAFNPGTPSWSVSGRKAKTVAKGSPTISLNFSPVLAADKVDACRRTILHEFGHALGFFHEHLHPELVINQELAEQQFCLSPDELYSDVIQRLPLHYFANLPPDPSSVMNYNVADCLACPKGWSTTQFNQFKDKLRELRPELSEGDKLRARRWYPPLSIETVETEEEDAPDGWFIPMMGTGTCFSTNPIHLYDLRRWKVVTVKLNCSIAKESQFTVVFVSKCAEPSLPALTNKQPTPDAVTEQQQIVAVKVTSTSTETACKLSFTSTSGHTTTSTPRETEFQPQPSNIRVYFEVILTSTRVLVTRHLLDECPTEVGSHLVGLSNPLEPTGVVGVEWPTKGKRAPAPCVQSFSTSSLVDQNNIHVPLAKK